MANRLAHETSPYLLQHAHNPVDWFPWGEEALSKARSEDKPILLSIGYSACHWCHVMERESFEDEATAAQMNEGFINIKVDREERPDLDSIYMRAVQASMGRGGWPLTAFLTPDGRFFYGGTYFPPEPRFGMPSFRQVLESVKSAFRGRREEIEKGAEQLLSALRGKPPSSSGSEALGIAASGESVGSAVEGLEGLLSREGPKVLDNAARQLARDFDPVHGGFGPAPKFPQPVTLEFLLRYFDRSGDPAVLGMVHTTLRSMSRGGMRDHLGGGFHRYSVDERWLVPHFEKMLYDNGLLARVYLHAYQITGDPELRDTVTSTLDYLLADLTDPDGGFYSARDADSEGEEGIFYIWRPEEVESVLGPEESSLFARAYDVSARGNFEGRNILHLSRSFDSLAETEGTGLEELSSRLARARGELRRARDLREPPFRDEKVLVAWNSFVLRALAEAALTLDRPDYLDAARKNADFILRSMGPGGRLHRSWKDGRSKIPAFLEDYAGLGNALLTLHETTLEPRWLEEAKHLAEKVVELFWEEEDGLFFDSPFDGEELVVRPREAMDSATPSGNSMAIELLLRVSGFFGVEELRRIALRALLAELEAASRFPAAFGRFLSATSLALTPPLEVVVVGDTKAAETKALLGVVGGWYLPARIVTGGDPNHSPALPLLEGRDARKGRATAYVCREFACSAPIHDSESLGLELAKSAKRVRSTEGRSE